MAPKKKRSAKVAKERGPFVQISASRYFKKAQAGVSRVNVAKFITDMAGIILNPVRFFQGLSSDGGYGDAIFKVAMYGLMALGVNILFNLSSITLVEAAYGVVAFSVAGVLLTFAFAGLLMLFSYLSKGEMDFEIALKSVAACMFMFPVAYAAYHLAFGYWTLYYLSLVIDLYIVFLIYTAVIYSMKGESGLSKIIFGAAAAFLLIVHWSGSVPAYLMLKNPRLVAGHIAAHAVEKSAK
jgi:hypothetical protein